MKGCVVVTSVGKGEEGHVVESCKKGGERCIVSAV